MFFDDDYNEILLYVDGMGAGKNESFQSPEEWKRYELEPGISIEDVEINGSNKSNASVFFEYNVYEPDLKPSGQTMEITITGGRSVILRQGGSVEIK